MKTEQLFLIVMFLLSAVLQYHLYLKDKRYNKNKIKHTHHKKQINNKF